MSKKIIDTTDGKKLQDKKTGKLAGSPPQKPTAPTPSIVSNSLEAYPITKDMTPQSINATYERYLMSKEEVEALAESRRGDVEQVLREEKVKNQEKEREADIRSRIEGANMVIDYYIKILLQDFFLPQGISENQARNVIKRALLKLNEARPPKGYDLSDNVKEKFLTSVKDMAQDKENFEPVAPSVYEVD